MTEIEALLQEYDRVSDEIRHIEAITQRALGIGVLIATGAYGVAIKENLVFIVALIPFLVLGLLFYGAAMYGTLFALGGYRRHIESRINLAAGRNIFTWEIIAQRVAHFSAAVIGLLAVLLISIFIVFSFSIISTFSWLAAGAPWRGKTILTPHEGTMPRPRPRSPWKRTTCAPTTGRSGTETTRPARAAALGGRKKTRSRSWPKPRRPRSRTTTSSLSARLATASALAGR